MGELAGLECSLRGLPVHSQYPSYHFDANSFEIGLDRIIHTIERSASEDVVFLPRIGI